MKKNYIMKKIEKSSSKNKTIDIKIIENYLNPVLN